MLSQELDVGMKCKWKRGWCSSQDRTRGCLWVTIVVDDQMQMQAGGHFGIKAFQKANEFLMSVTGHAIADNSAVEHTESREQRGRTVAFVVVCLPGRQSGT